MSVQQSAPNPAMPEPAAMTSRILSLREAVTVEELQNDEEYNDIVEDMREECGKVRSIPPLTCIVATSSIWWLLWSLCMCGRTAVLFLVHVLLISFVTPAGPCKIISVQGREACSRLGFCPSPMHALG